MKRGQATGWKPLHCNNLFDDQFSQFILLTLGLYLDWRFLSAMTAAAAMGESILMSTESTLKDRVESNEDGDNEVAEA